MFEFVHNRPLLPVAISVEFCDFRLSDEGILCDYGIPRGTQLDVSFAKFRCFAVIDPKGASFTSRVGDKGRLMTLKKVYGCDKRMDFEWIGLMSCDDVASDTTILTSLYLRGLIMVPKVKELIVEVRGQHDEVTRTPNDAMQKLAEHFNFPIDQIAITTPRRRLFGGSRVFSVPEAIACSVLGPKAPTTKDNTLTDSRVVCAFRYHPFSLFPYDRKLEGSKTLAVIDLKLDVPVELSSGVAEKESPRCCWCAANLGSQGSGCRRPFCCGSRRNC
jgi:hypothetical protein